jgi:hypothetical protein
MAYNEKAVNAFAPVELQLRALRLPLVLQRRYNGIANAIVMQVEEDGLMNTAVIAHLRSALLALAEGDKVGAEQQRRIAAAFDKFEAQL